MKLARDAIISEEKLTSYLLAPRKRNDKSKWLAQAGYTRKYWRTLRNDLKNLLFSMDASAIGNTVYGDMYEIRARLTGPNGRSLPVRTIWMIENATNITKFITMYPDKGRSDHDV